MVKPGQVHKTYSHRKRQVLSFFLLSPPGRDQGLRKARHGHLKLTKEFANPGESFPKSITPDLPQTNEVVYTRWPLTQLPTSAFDSRHEDTEYKRLTPRQFVLR